MPLDFRNKTMLAPMVRISTLPMRLLALEYGADIVYGPEIVDKRLIGSERVVNELLGTVDYVKGKQLNFRTIPSIEKSRLVFQLGSSDPDLALAAAKVVEPDVSAIDLNCGCPKSFSILGGMGAALLSNPDKLCAILEKLVNNLSVDVTCKIRMLSTKEETIELCKRIEKTGVKAIAVHCRTRYMPPQVSGDWSIFKAIAEEIKSIPIIANGDIFEREHMQKLREQSTLSSFMVARGAQANPSIFHPSGPFDIETVVRSYIQKSIMVDNIWQNTKYTLLCMYNATKDSKYKKSVQSKCFKDLAEIWGLKAEFERVEKERQERKMLLEERKQQVLRSLNEDGGVDSGMFLSSLLSDFVSSTVLRFWIFFSYPRQSISSLLCSVPVARQIINIYLNLLRMPIHS
ncbi:hypothetical protein BKA69DRAFT_1025258 [Paraphysoderma sedebokerense]|nr:hypothetical protein BKA69DRAFT_662191 [Paraphysoderma sedebokerense]KAI9145120.1 hypothetical protein BKA69DRAFT_1025258 [Paraphysoderma sedebokerense]